MKKNDVNERSVERKMGNPSKECDGIPTEIEKCETATTTNGSNNADTEPHCFMNCFYVVKNKEDAINVDKYQQKTVYCHGVTPAQLHALALPKSSVNEKQHGENIAQNKELSLTVQLANDNNCREFVLIRTNHLCGIGSSHHQHKYHQHDGTSNWLQHGHRYKEDDSLSCRICHSVTGTNYEPLVSPCLCTGSMKYVHESCLINWLKSSVKTKCELCLHDLQIKKSLMPLNQWRRPVEKPVALVWLLTFLVALTLNIISITKDASRRCTATACIIYYIVGSTGALLGFVFLVFWAVKSASYVKKWLTFNQVWKLEERYFRRKRTSLKTPV